MDVEEQWSAKLRKLETAWEEDDFDQAGFVAGTCPGKSALAGSRDWSATEWNAVRVDLVHGNFDWSLTFSVPGGIGSLDTLQAREASNRNDIFSIVMTILMSILIHSA